MLVLSRKLHEEIHIGHDIVLKVVDIGGGKVRLGIEAPRSVTINRAEVAPKSASRPVATSPNLPMPLERGCEQHSALQ